MAGSRKRTLKSGLAALAIAGATAFAVDALLTQTVHAQPLPVYKMCTGPNSDGTSAPGGTTMCDVFAVPGNLATGIYAVRLDGPGTSQIVACGPATGVTSATQSGNTCTYTVLVTVTPNEKIATETIHIGLSTNGQSITQSAYECGPPNPITPCPPPQSFTSISTIGNGSCVGAGNTVSPLGGCLSTATSPPTTTTTSSTTHTNTTNDEGGGGGGTTENEAGETTGAVQGATATKFTGGPDHPFPVAATTIAVIGGLLAVATGLGPSLLRRRRQSRSGN